MSRAVVLILWVITAKGIFWHSKRGNVNFLKLQKKSSMVIGYRVGLLTLKILFCFTITMLSMTDDAMV